MVLKASHKRQWDDDIFPKCSKKSSFHAFLFTFACLVPPQTSNIYFILMKIRYNVTGSLHTFLLNK